MCEVLVEAPALVLVNNAGVAPRLPSNAPDDAWRRVMDVNVTAPQVYSRGRPRDEGREVGAHREHRLDGGPPGISLYGRLLAQARDPGQPRRRTRRRARGDHGQRGLSWIYRHRHGDAPSTISRQDRPRRRDRPRRAGAPQPPGRLVTLDEVAALVAYLCSDAAASVHGQPRLDGGETDDPYAPASPRPRGRLLRLSCAPLLLPGSPVHTASPPSRRRAVAPSSRRAVVPSCREEARRF